MSCLVWGDTVNEIVEKISDLNGKCAHFWRRSAGWAPPEAAELLSNARLDWQVSLSKTLRIWLREDGSDLEDGELILAWTNLGALVEGTLKLFLSVYYLDYRDDLDALKATNAFDNRREKQKEPAGLGLEILRSFVEKKDFFDSEIYNFLKLVQQRRNAIHAYEDRPVGNTTEFHKAVTTYFHFLTKVDSRLPYP